MLEMTLQTCKGKSDFTFRGMDFVSDGETEFELSLSQADAANGKGIVDVITQFIRKMDKRLGIMEKGFGSVDKRFGAVEGQIKAEVSKLNKKIHGVENRRHYFFKKFWYSDKRIISAYLTFYYVITTSYCYEEGASIGCSFALLLFV